MIRLFLFLAALLGALIGPAYRVTQNWNWASVLLTIFILGFCANSNYSLLVVMTLIIVILFWSGYSMVRNWPIKMEQVSHLMNLVGLLVVVFYGNSVFMQLPKLPQSYFDRVLDGNRTHSVATLVTQNFPDIYYIVLDGYARNDVLKELYRFDNSDFLQFLAERQFIIPTKSRSNYPKTAVSVASTLNMEYISTLTPGLENSYNWWLMSPLIDQSQTRTILEQFGYQSVSITSGFGITDNPTTDIYYHPTPIVFSDFETYFLNRVPLSITKPLLSKIAFIPSYEAHRNLIEFDFDTLARIPDLPNPTFTFVHIIAPHPPFVFDANGNFLQPDYSFSFKDANDFPHDDEQYRQGYIGQVQFVNNRLEKLMEVLINRSKAPPIIILQADHGPGMLTDFHTSANTCLKERFSIFAAYYLPGIDPEIIPIDITPVNVFRIIFNEYFGSDLPMLERKHYYYQGTNYIFRTEDVTEIVDSCTLPET